MTKDQKELIRKHQYASIRFRPAEEMPAPAYCVKGKVHYEVFLTKEFREDKNKKKFLRTLLLHELGHLECRHLDVDYDHEFAELKAAQERYEIKNNIKDADKKILDLSLALNIAGDLEVNSKYLTLGDIKYLTEQGLTPITLKNFDATYKDHFYEYYDEVIAKMYLMPSSPVIILDMDKSLCTDTPLKTNGKGEGNPKSGNSKPSDVETETVSGVVRETSDDYEKEMSEENEEEKAGDSSDQSESKKSGRGLGNSNVIITRSKKETEEELVKLLISIKDIKRIKQLDPLRLYNRGTRRNDSGILYTSLRRKVSKNTEKLGILVDVSGSMDTSSVMKAVETIAKVAPHLHRDTKVKCWQSVKSDEFYLDKIPNKVRSGGGTYLPAGLQEFINEGYDNVVVYSDFDDALQDYVRVYDSHPCKLYLVAVDANVNSGMWKSSNWSELVKRAVKVIFTSNKQ